MKKLLLIAIIAFSFNTNVNAQTASSIISALVGSWNHAGSCGYGFTGKYMCNAQLTNYNPPTEYYIFSTVAGSQDSVHYEYYRLDTLRKQANAYVSFGSTFFGNQWNIKSLWGTGVQIIDLSKADTISFKGDNCADCYAEILTKRIDCRATYKTSYDTVQNTFTLKLDSATVATASSYFWDFGDGTTSTLATPSHTYTVDTVYDVCLTVTTGASEQCTYCHKIGKDYLGHVYRTSGFTIRVVNGNTQTEITSVSSTENSFVIYPNPTNSSTEIVFNRAVDNVNIKISNITGQAIFQKTGISGSRFNLDLNDQPAGIYFVETLENGTVSRVKLIKE
jgi:PKD domain/Secretion system C-terminal sorting domain